MNEDDGRVIGLEAHNIMQLRAVKIDLQDKNLVVISGRNGAGKSTALDLFLMTVWGAALCPKEPISRGEREGFAQVEMVGYTARREFWLTKSDELASKLILKSKEGAEFKSPRAMLDKILGPKTVDPLALTHQMLKEPKKARDILLEMAGVDINLDELARDRQNLYDQRTRVNRNIKDKKGELAGTATPNPGLLVDEVSVVRLIRKHQDAVALKALNDETRAQPGYAQEDLDDINEKIAYRLAEIARFQGQIDELERGRKITAKQVEECTREAANLKDPDMDAISQSIEKAEETNREIRAAKDLQTKRTTLGIVLESLDDDSNQFTHRIDDLDAQKAEALQGAKFPVEGLTVDENGIRFADFPLAQASQSERIKVGLAISAKMNPLASLLRIYEGSALDSANLGVIETFAKKNNLTILMEVVDETGNVGIVIEDGVVVKVN